MELGDLEFVHGNNILPDTNLAEARRDLRSSTLEPFFIFCTTCQAKLRVRDASAVGQILTCPKCGSMVLIEAPANSIPATAVAPSPETSPAKPPPRPAPRPETKNAASHAASSSIGAGLASELADTVEDPTQYGTVEARQSAEDKKTGTESSTLEASTTELAALPTADWTTVESQNRRRWILATLAGTTGVLLAVALFAFLAGRQPHSASHANNPLPGTQTVPKSDSTATAPSQALSHPDPQDNGIGTLGPIENPSASVLPDGKPVDQPGAEPAPLVPMPRTDGPPTKDASPIPGSPPDEVLAGSPPEFAPGGDEKPKARGSSSPGSLPDTLRKLGGLFDPSPADAEKDPASDVVTATPKETAAPPAVDEPIRLSRPAPRVINVTARLADPIVEIEFKNTPLVDFLQFVSNFSTIPVTLDPDVLMWLEITPVTPVSVALRDTNLSNLLHEVLGKIGLTYQTVDQQLFVTRKSTGEAKRVTKLNVSDLVADDPKKLSELRDHIVNLIAPETWLEGGASGKLTIDGTSLVVEHADKVLFDVIALCERIRVARGLPTRSRFDAKDFQLATRSERIKSQLAKPLTLNYPRPTSFVRILSRVSKESGLQILVDWQAIADAGWNPDAEVSFTVENQPLAKALDTLLKPMELDYRIVNETTVQITTPAVLEVLNEVEIYPLVTRSGSAPDVARIWDALPAGWFREVGGTGTLRYDAESHSLLVSLPQPRQRALQGILAEMAKK